MPSVSKSKNRSNNRTTSGAVKEQLKDIVKPAISISGGNGTSAIADSPTIVTSHQLENAVHCNAEECDAHSGSSGTGLEYDSVSNNGSYSGESEDLKEKHVSNIVDAEKREKIRLRNEKKHQRQRERRAQELHERCSSVLMSRKLESLSRQLVSMGFTSERANLALMANDGKLEESVSWLLEGNTEVSKKVTNLADECTLKIDIADLLTQVLALETRYNCSKKDVERAVVSSEGDLQKAEEILHGQQREMLLSSNRSEENNNNSNTVLALEKSVATDSIRQRKSERDLNNPNAVHVGATHSESVSKYQQLLRESRANGISDGLWQPSVSNMPRNTFAPATSVLLRPSTNVNVVDGRGSSAGHVANNIHQTVIREPLTVMQRPQSSPMKQVLQSSTVSTPGRVTGSYPISAGGYESLVPGGNVQFNQNVNSVGSRNVHPQQTNYQSDYRHQDPAANLSQTSSRQLGGFGSRNAMTPSSPQLNVPSSLGLFSSRTSGQSHVDWNHVDWYAAGQMPWCDYTSIDWTMDSNLLSKSKAEWDGLGLSSIWKKHNTNNGDAMSGFSEGLMAGRNMAVGSHEWTSSPFGGKDFFSDPRQFVNSSSLW
ncbi:unnamed protein product [Rhodiola kirilowii]